MIPRARDPVAMASARWGIKEAERHACARQWPRQPVLSNSALTVELLLLLIDEQLVGSETWGRSWPRLRLSGPTPLGTPSQAVPSSAPAARIATPWKWHGAFKR